MTRNAFDMSSFLKTALLTGKDNKDGRLVVFNDKQILVNSAEYGYEIVTNMMVKALRDTGVQPRDCLLVFEGKNSKGRRLLIDANYKGKRDQRPPEFYEEFIRLREYIEQEWKSLGAIAMSQDNVEADDVLAWLAQETEEDLYISTRDNDIGALNTEDGINKHGARVITNIDGLMGVTKLDSVPFIHPARYVTLYKALVGDSSDNIPGVAGFGPAKFQTLAEKYGYDGLDELMGLLEAGKLDPLQELADEMTGKGKSAKHAHPQIKLIMDAEQDAVRSWKLAKLYPEWINTSERPVSIRPGKIVERPENATEALAEYYGVNYLVTADEYDEACQMFKEQLAASDPEIAFDIETSTPPESDDWLALQGNPEGVDQLGSVLTGFSFTFGANANITFYVSVDHADTKNIKMSQARNFIELAIQSGKKLIIQNNFFELTVLAQAVDEDGESWSELWKGLGARGFLPNTLDTKFEANYVNENIKSGLKFRSKHHLGYEQVEYKAVTTLQGHPDELPKGGRRIEVLEWDTVYATPEQLAAMDLPEGTDPKTIFENVPRLVRRQYKMRELPASHVFSYGCDDTICTAALHNYYKLIMQLEHTWNVYLDVEIAASYQHAKNFLDGITFSLETMKKQEAHDKLTFDAAWATVRKYLMENGWEGTVPPTYTAEITAKQIKEAYKIVMGGQGDEEEEDIPAEAEDEDDDEDEDQSGRTQPEEPKVKDPFLSTRTRTPAKLVVLLRELGHAVFAGMVEACLAGEHERFTAWVRESFSGEPVFSASNKQMKKLLYTVMALPIRARNKPTKLMKAKGLEGNAKGDGLACDYGIRDGNDEQKEVLKGIKLMRMVMTRENLYYSTHPYFLHWKTGRIHSTHNQCATNTRRASVQAPNDTQWPKHQKITGQPAPFRETIIPHHENAVVASLDFDSQELRIIADYSKDANLVACFVGDNKKSMHSLTGHGIAIKRKKVPVTMTYEEFDHAAKHKDHPLHEPAKEMRALGKKVNFTTEFGAMAPKLSMTLMCTEEEAQTYIDAKEANFPGVRVWKTATIADAKRVGYVVSMLGARRHLAAAFNGDDYYAKSKAERQSVNFRVQGSAAEMTKKAEGRVWDAGLVYKYDAVCYGPKHDELVFSVHKDQLADFLVEAHACMVAPYGGMTIPIESSISFGPNFGVQAEIGITPTAEAVAQGWAELEEIAAKKAKVAA